MPETIYIHAKLLGHYYEQFDADTSLAVPAEGYGGWKSTEVEICLETEELVEIVANDPEVAKVLEARKRESGSRSEGNGADMPRRLH